MKIWKQRGCIFQAAVGTALLATAYAAPVPLAQVPPAVQQAIRAQLGNGTLGEIDRDEEDGKVTYTFEVTKAGRSIDYTLDEKGALVSVEVTLFETPLAVQKTIQSQIGQGTLESIDKAIEDGKTTYDVAWQDKEGRDHSFGVLESGQLDSVQVILEETPPPVRAAITKAAGPGHVMEIYKTFEGPEFYYDVTVNGDGPDREISVTADGKVESRQVFLTELAPPVQATIHQNVGPGKIVHIDQVFEGKKGSSYDIEAVKDGKAFSFNVGPKGAFRGFDQ